MRRDYSVSISSGKAATMRSIWRLTCLVEFPTSRHQGALHDRPCDAGPDPPTLDPPRD
jgi:hypothetical protein